MTQSQIRLNDTDQAILTEIDDHGRATVTLLATVLEPSRTYIAERVRRLREHDVLVEVSPNLYDRPEQADEYLPADATSGGDT